MAWSRTSRHARGYDKHHERIRKQLLADEPLCRVCAAQGIVTAATIADHQVPLSKGGKTVRSNMQPICAECHKAKTAAESGRPLKTKTTIGLDGWPV